MSRKIFLSSHFFYIVHYIFLTRILVSRASQEALNAHHPDDHPFIPLNTFTQKWLLRRTCLANAPTVSLSSSCNARFHRFPLHLTRFVSPCEKEFMASLRKRLLFGTMLGKEFYDGILFCNGDINFWGMKLIFENLMKFGIYDIFFRVKIICIVIIARVINFWGRN